MDALLGVPGVPQSGTGQSTLLTGRNTARLYGRHFGPWIPTSLRGLVREESILARARRAGRSVAFANAYPEELVRPVTGGGQTDAGGARIPPFLRAGPPLAALGAGVLDRGTAELERGTAIASEITNQAWRDRLGRRTLPDIDAAQAGRNLAHIAAGYDLTLFAHYATDHVGHERNLGRAVEALQLVDAFLGGVLDASEDFLLILTSDHGNLEDARVGHTTNPALCLVTGPGHADLAPKLVGLEDVAEAVLHALRHDRGGG